MPPMVGSSGLFGVGGMKHQSMLVDNELAYAKA